MYGSQRVLPDTKRQDSKQSYAVRLIKDIDTGEAVLIYRDTSIIREDNEEYYTIRLGSFCEQVNVGGVRKDKYMGQTGNDWRSIRRRILGGKTQAIPQHR